MIINLKQITGSIAKAFVMCTALRAAPNEAGELIQPPVAEQKDGTLQNPKYEDELRTAADFWNEVIMANRGETSRTSRLKEKIVVSEQRVRDLEALLTELIRDGSMSSDDPNLDSVRKDLAKARVLEGQLKADLEQSRAMASIIPTPLPVGTGDKNPGSRITGLERGRTLQSGDSNINRSVISTGENGSLTETGTPSWFNLPFATIPVGAAATTLAALLVLLLYRKSLEEKEKPNNVPSNNNDDDLSEIVDTELSDESITESIQSVRDEFEKELQNTSRVRMLSKNISPAQFKRHGLLPPSYKFEFNGASYYLSKPFMDTNWDRASFFLYLVKQNPNDANSKEIFARGVYKSNSHCVWRVASHTDFGEDFIGKGKGEHTTTIPLEIQSRLENILRDRDWDVKRSAELSRVLVKLFPYDSPESFVAEKHDSVVKHVLFGRFEGSNPASFKYIHDGLKPNFEDGIIEKFESKNDLCGDVTSYLVESKNKQLIYQFNLVVEDGKPLAWISDIQYSSSPLNEHGVKRSTVPVHKLLLLPAYEYESQIPYGFTGKVNPRNSHYFDASKFTNQLPPVREFLTKVVGRAESKFADYVPKLRSYLGKIDREDIQKPAIENLIDAINSNQLIQIQYSSRVANLFKTDDQTDSLIRQIAEKVETLCKPAQLQSENYFTYESPIQIGPKLWICSYNHLPEVFKSPRGNKQGYYVVDTKCSECLELPATGKPITTSYLLVNEFGKDSIGNENNLEILFENNMIKINVSDSVAIDEANHIREMLSQGKLIEAQFHIHQALTKYPDDGNLKQIKDEIDAKRNPIIVEPGKFTTVEYQEGHPIAIGNSTLWLCSRNDVPSLFSNEIRADETYYLLDAVSGDKLEFINLKTEKISPSLSFIRNNNQFTLDNSGRPYRTISLGMLKNMRRIALAEKEMPVQAEHFDLLERILGVPGGTKPSEKLIEINNELLQRASDELMTSALCKTLADQRQIILDFNPEDKEVRIDTEEAGKVSISLPEDLVYSLCRGNDESNRESHQASINIIQEAIKKIC